MFEPDQPVDAILFGKAVDDAGTMLMDSFYQMAGDTDIQGAMSSARKDIDAWLVGHDASMKSEWMPDQVRHDANKEKTAP